MNIFAKVKRRIRVWKELSVNHSNIVEKYKDKKESVDFVNKPAPIWVCWLQGEENAPEVVKSCIRSIRENNKKHPINFISMNNISDYIEIPEIILEKWKKKQISPTHFSDYIRSALLAKFGGIWMDATLFCVKELPEEFFSMPFFPGTKYKSVGIRRFKGGLLGFWTTYFMGSNLKNSIIFSFLRDGLLDFWKKNNSVELYSFFDLILLIGFFRIKTIKNHIKSNKTINVNTDSLAKLMSKPFSRSKLNQIKKNQCVFKLSYKKAWKEYYKGERTFYWYCIHEPESLWL